MIVNPEDNGRRINGLTANGDGHSIGKRELRLIESGLKRWPTTAGDRAKTLAKLMSFLDQCQSPRDVAAVTRVIASIEEQNQKDAHFLLKKDNIDPDDLPAVAREFRVEFDS